MEPEMKKPKDSVDYRKHPAKRVFPKDTRTTAEVMRDFYKNGFQ